MSAKNGKLVALRAALLHSVPAHVHELQRQASELEAKKEELLTYFWEKTEELQYNIHWRKYLAARNLITDAHDKDTGFQCWEAFLSAELSEERPSLPEERSIYEHTSRLYAKVSMSYRQTRAGDTYTIKHNDIVWCKSLKTDVAVTTGYQKCATARCKSLAFGSTTGY